ncbi:MAG: hypothetical protein HY882_09650 [Deltaproteobacteria bacterium]|nr:hypothetical protein [Deltaproteobacteria bacterium]
MTSFLKLKSSVAYSIAAAMLMASLGCSYKPPYLQKSARTEVSERWKVVKIDPSRLSPDEASVFEKMGSPQYVRFYRELNPLRERVYEWVYTDPVRLISFVEGKQVDYVVVDDDLSPLNHHERKLLFWGGIGAATAGGLGLLYYYFGGK